MDIISNEGRTSIVYRVGGGLVWKAQRSDLSDRFLAEIDNAFIVEREVLQRLGVHPSIVRYYGLFRTSKDMKDGLLLEEACGGDLQSYIDRNGSALPKAVRQKWCLQAAGGLAYIHSKDVVHANICPPNLLLRGTDLVLADFGGSKCRDLELDGRLVPDAPFRDPQLTEFDSPKVDLFSLGIVIYIIMTGHYPFREGPAPQGEERYSYRDRVQQRFEQGEFPDLSNVQFGEVIAGCCCERRFENAREVVIALEAAMQKHTSWRSAFAPGVVAPLSMRYAVVVFLAWMLCLGLVKAMSGESWSNIV